METEDDLVEEAEDDRVDETEELRVVETDEDRVVETDDDRVVETDEDRVVETDELRVVETEEDLDVETDDERLVEALDAVAETETGLSIPEVPKVPCRRLSPVTVSSASKLTKRSRTCMRSVFCGDWKKSVSFQKIESRKT